MIGVWCILVSSRFSMDLVNVIFPWDIEYTPLIVRTLAIISQEYFDANWRRKYYGQSIIEFATDLN